MFLTKLKIATAVLLVVASIGFGAAGVYRALEEQPPVAQGQPAPARFAPDPGALAKEPAQVKKPGAIFRVSDSFTTVVALTPDGKLLALGGSDTTVRLWNVASGKEIHTLKGHTACLNCLKFAPDGKTLASATGDWGPDDRAGEVKLWDVSTGKERVPVKGHRISVRSMAFSADGKTLATSSDGPATVKLWDVATGKEKMELGVFAWSLAFSPDGKTLATGAGGGPMDLTPSSVILWDMTTGKKRATLPGHPNSITCVEFAPDGKTLASVSVRGDNEEGHAQLKLWDVATAKERATIALPGYAPIQYFSLAFTADGNTLISAMWSFHEKEKVGGFKKGGLAVQHWEVTTGKARATLWAPRNAGGHNPSFSALSADGKTVTWGGVEGRDKKITGTAHVWEVQSLLPKEPEKPVAEKPLEQQADNKPADAPQENAAKKEIEKLQGTWQLVAAEIFRSGSAFKGPKEEVEMEKVIIKGDNWTYRSARGREQQARYQLGATKEPKTIDLVWTDGDNKGKTYPGVFSLEGDTLKICYAREGKERPAGFTAEATKQIKDHCVLMVLKREKP